jgi:hypothetical protein
MTTRELLVSLPPNHQLAFMTECLRRAVEVSRESLDHTTSVCLEKILSLAWQYLSGEVISDEERKRLHVQIEKVGIRNSPRKGGTLEVYYCANAATFVLGIIVNPKNLQYSDTCLHVVPDVYRAIHLSIRRDLEDAEGKWQEQVLARLQTCDSTPCREWFVEE